MSRPATDTATQIVARFNPSDGDVVTPLKVQKLIYYAHGWSLALRGEPLFDEFIEAWKDGPVVHSVYRHFASFGSDAITLDSPPKVTRDSLLDAVVATYGGKLASWLRNQTHREAPWLRWYDGSMRNAIPHDELCAFFVEQRDNPSFPVHQEFLDAWLVEEHGAVWVDSSRLNITQQERESAARELGLR